MSVTEYRLYLIEGPGYSGDVHFLPRNDAIVLKLQGYDVWDAHAALDIGSEWIEDDPARNK